MPEVIQTELAVLGGGPGGYTAAFEAAARGMEVTLIEREPLLGGVCLLRGCIPSKAYLHATEIVETARRSEHRGIRFDPPRIRADRLREWKETMVRELGDGLGQESDRHGVRRLTGRGYFESSHRLRVEMEEGQQYVDFQQAIVATGSRPVVPGPFDLGHPKVITSREALKLEESEGSMLVVGGGYIGLELGTVYARLGSRVELVEMEEELLPGIDRDLCRPVEAAVDRMFDRVRTGVKIESVKTSGDQLAVRMGEEERLFDQILVAVGRQPNSDTIGLENTEVKLSEKGHIEGSTGGETADPRIRAIGDVAGGMQLAHKAAREGRDAVRALTGESVGAGDWRVPAVIYTDPEIAWVGWTESEANRENVEVRTVKYPWKASGRARSCDRTDGLTKLLFDPKNERLLGGGITGHGASELIAEVTHALEMAATARDLAETVHPHPTLSETVMEAALRHLASSG